MTDAPTPVVLRHGKLTADLVPLLKAGSSVLRSDKGAIGLFESTDVVDGTVSLDLLAGGVAFGLAPRSVTYIGELADGWINAPKGGWTECPAPGMRIDVRTLGTGEGANLLSDQWGVSWLSEDLGEAEDIIAFRLSDQPLSPEEESGSLRASPFVPTEPLDDLLDRLERLAMAATPGDWKTAATDDSLVLKGRQKIASVFGVADNMWGAANAAFIAAANPATILKLIEAARQGGRK